MSHKWPTVKVGDVLNLDTNRISVDPTVTYPMVGVLSFGRGLFDREPIVNGNTSYKFFYRLDADHFVMSQLFGWEGALALSSGDYAGKYLSPQFPTFRCNPSKLDRRFLGWVTRRPEFWDQLGKKASGMGDRRRTLTPDALLTTEIPLPPLSEQHRIVDLIEAIAGKLDEARRLRKEAAEEAGVLLASRTNEIFDQLAREFPPQPFSSFDPHVTSGPRNWAKHYEVGGHRFYRAQDIGQSGLVLNESRVYVSPPPGGQGRSATLVAGDLMIVITGATVGRVALFVHGMQPGFVSQHVAICRLPRNQVNSEFVLWGLRGPDGQSQLLGQRYGQGKPGLNLKNVGALSLPFPPIEEQNRVVQYLRAYGRVVEELVVEQESSAAEIRRTLPSVLDKAFRGEFN